MAGHVPLMRSTPEAQGVPSLAILTFIEELERSVPEMHGLVLLRHGQVIAEGWWKPYGPKVPHMLYSLSKSFTSTAIGMAVAEGRLMVDDRVLSFFPEEAPMQPDENLQAMTIHHLLSMSTGHDTDPSGRVFSNRNWVKAFLSLPVEHVPGTHFCYNTAATYMLSAILQKVTGERLIDYLRPRLFEPLGITGAFWESCPLAINTGGFGLMIKTEDIARFGQLYLNKGIWNGQRLIAAEWIEQATRKQIPNGDNPESDWNQGYGYQFWRCRYNNYRGDGAFGQYCIVMPEQDAVLAINSGVTDMQAVLNKVWDCLLPTFAPAPLKENPRAQEELARRLSGLCYDPPAGESTSPLAAKISGRKLIFPENPLKITAAVLDFGPEQAHLRLEMGKQVHIFACGLGAWQFGKSRMFDRYVRATAVSGTWTAPDTFQVTIRYYETPHNQTIRFQFSEDGARVESAMNVSFGPTQSPVLEGLYA